MSFLLALESSSTTCSVALLKEGSLIGISELQIEKSHSSHITVLIDQLLHNCKVNFSDLVCIAISDGPGSYTGLRIGSSTVKGLCYALDIPLVAVSTLYGLALGAILNTPNPENFIYCPMVDARRMEVYTCMVNNQLKEILSVAPIILDEAIIKDYLKNPNIIFLGSGASKLDEFNLEKKPNIIYNIKPTAGTIGKLGWQKYLDKKFEEVTYYEPFYLKEVYITSSKK